RAEGGARGEQHLLHADEGGRGPGRGGVHGRRRLSRTRGGAAGLRRAASARAGREPAPVLARALRLAGGLLGLAERLVAERLEGEGLRPRAGAVEGERVARVLDDLEPGADVRGG